jgi:hypothetical protein
MRQWAARSVRSGSATGMWETRLPCKETKSPLPDSRNRQTGWMWSPEEEVVMRSLRKRPSPSWGDAGGGSARHDYQVAGFLGYQLSRRWAIALGYRYLSVNYRPNGNAIRRQHAGRRDGRNDRIEVSKALNPHPCKVPGCGAEVRARQRKRRPERGLRPGRDLGRDEVHGPSGTRKEPSVCNT